MPRRLPALVREPSLLAGSFRLSESLVRPRPSRWTPNKPKTKAAFSVRKKRLLSAPYTIRTCGLRFRRPTLYPAELRVRGRS